MAIRVQFKLNGLEEYLSNVNKVGNDIVQATKEAIEESVKPIVEEMKVGAEPHILTSKVYNAIEATPVKVDGNKIYSDVGINEEKAKEGAWTAVFQEFGSPHFPKSPFIRPAFDNNRSKIKSAQRKILKKWGVPVD